MTLLLLSLLLGGAPVASGTSPAAAVCPVEAPVHRSTANWFISHPSLSAARSEAGVAGADSTQLRLLTDAMDATVCQQLNVRSAPGGVLGTPPNPWVYYQLGNRYVVVSASRPSAQPGVLSARMRFLAVFDGQFNFVTGFGF